MPRTDNLVPNYQRTGRVEKNSSLQPTLQENVPKTADEVRDSASPTTRSDELQKDQILDIPILERKYPIRVRTKPK